MNYAQGQSSPTYKHRTFEDAQREAQRLCEKLNTEVVTLRAVASIAPAPKFVNTEFEGDELPF